MTHKALRRAIVSFPLLILLLFGLTLSGCKLLGDKPNTPSTSSQATPAWVSQPPSDNRSTIYGLGSGRDLETAKQNALNDIAGKLEVHVSSDTQYRNLIRDDKASSSYSENIKTKVKQTRLSNYQIRETAFVNGTAFSLVAMSRDALIRDTQTELDKAQAELDVLLGGVKQKSKLEQLLTYSRASAQARESLPTVAMMRAANPEFAFQPYYDRIREFDELEKELSEQATFRVSGSKDLSSLAERLQMKLSEMAFRVTQDRSADVLIELSGELKQEQIFSTYSAHGDMRIRVLAGSGKQLYSSTQRLQGSSVSGYAQATENALKKFENSLKSRDDIFALLGLN